MYYIDKLKEQITKISTGIVAALAHMDSPEFKAECEAQYGKGCDTYPSKLGFLRAATGITTIIDLNRAAWLVENAAPEIAWGERCAALCEALGIDDDSIAEMELMASHDRYRSELGDVTKLIAAQSAGIRDDAREMEHGSTVAGLEAAGFASVQRDDFEGWERGVSRVIVEYKKRNREGWYEFTLEVDGQETLRGKSGEFAALLAAVGITQEVKAQ